MTYYHPPRSIAPQLRPKMGQKARLWGAPLEGGPFYQGKRSQKISRSNFPMDPGAKSPIKGGGL